MTSNYVCGIWVECECGLRKFRNSGQNGSLDQCISVNFKFTSLIVLVRLLFLRVCTILGPFWTSTFSDLSCYHYYIILARFFEMLVHPRLLRLVFSFTLVLAWEKIRKQKSDFLEGPIHGAPWMNFRAKNRHFDQNQANRPIPR